MAREFERRSLISEPAGRGADCARRGGWGVAPLPLPVAMLFAPLAPFAPLPPEGVSLSATGAGDGLPSLSVSSRVHSLRGPDRNVSRVRDARCYANSLFRLFPNFPNPRLWLNVVRLSRRDRGRRQSNAPASRRGVEISVFFVVSRVSSRRSDLPVSSAVVLTNRGWNLSYIFITFILWLSMIRRRVSM